jgi:hypothetical protein
LEPWRSPNFFFPAQDVLGYSEGFLLFALFYIPFRLLHFDPFSSYQTTLGLLLALGYAGMALLLHKGFRVRPVPGSIAAGIFAFSWMNFAADAQTQMYSVALIPYLGLAAMYAFRRSDLSRRLNLRPALTAVALFALLALTSFYCTWFLSFILSVSAVTALVLFSWKLGVARVASVILGWVRINWPRLLLLAAVAACLLIPFSRPTSTLANKPCSRNRRRSVCAPIDNRSAPAVRWAT